MANVLLAGDAFVTPDVLGSALALTVPDAATTTLVNEWPATAFSSIGEVHEAQGDEDKLIEALQGVEVAFTHTFPFTEKVLAASPSLRLITVCRGGPVNVNAEAAARHGVTVTFTPGRNATATAEHSVAMILAAVRQVAQRHGELVAGEWRGDYYRYEQVGPEVRGSTVGLVGYGAIGARVAHVLLALGARVVVFDPYVDASTLEDGIELVAELDDLLRQSNILTIHARLTEATQGLIGAREIGLLPAGAVLVNCARGGLLDYDALCDALDSGHLYAAACDVLPFEPLPADHRILSTPRLTVTPHLAGASKQAAELAASIGAADIAKFLAGERPEHVVSVS
ncbi:MAG: 2-hydroxyacid dehydrogenase [Actinomycetaceae bacterium]